MTNVNMLKFTFGEEECIRMLKEAFKKECRIYVHKSIANPRYAEHKPLRPSMVDLAEVMGGEEAMYYTEAYARKYRAEIEDKINGKK